MLYTLYEFFGINLFQYITVRAGLAFFLALFLTLFLTPLFIRWAKKQNASQPIYDLAPKNHQKKSYTPTMGGIIFLFSTLLATVFCAKTNNAYIILGELLMISFGLVGIKDDFEKIFSNSNQSGLSSKKKLLFQTIISLGVGITFYFSTKNSGFYLPFFKNEFFDMGLFAIVFWTVVMVGTSNAVNLTDGLDGLATVPSIFALLTLGAFVYLSGHVKLADYLLINYMPSIGELSIMTAGLVGGLVGFLWYNCHPAEIFMGDTGSLTIGAFIAYLAIVTKNEILLLLIGFIFVLETISVIVQVFAFKKFGKRVFLMAPLHHHFELKKWHENKIIVRFWLVAALFNIIALISLKIR